MAAFNPLDKAVELYEWLLKAERDKKSPSNDGLLCGIHHRVLTAQTPDLFSCIRSIATVNQ